MDPRPRERPWPFQGPISGRMTVRREVRWRTVWRPSPAPTCCSTPTTPSTGTPGARRPSRRPEAEDRPIFLSIGYSTCYWCHVMERESFSDPEVARAMNESFVNIKVDREERPDVDEIYMIATQLLTRARGLAELGVPDAGPRALLRRHLLPSPRRPGEARVLAGAAGASPGLAPPAPRADAAGRGRSQTP